MPQPENDFEHTKRLIKVIDSELKKIKKATTPIEITSSERALVPIMKELQISSARVWGDVSKAVLKRRQELKELD